MLDIKEKNLVNLKRSFPDVSAFGNFIENLRNKKDVKFISEDLQQQYFWRFTKTTFMVSVVVSYDLITIPRKKGSLFLNRLICVRLSAPERMKRKMSDFHNNIVLQEYQNNVNLFSLVLRLLFESVTGHKRCS